MSENNVASRGDFRGDFSRDTFDPMKHFSRVLMQQGRVQLDADWNEQVSILLHYMRQLGADLMGPHGAPHPDDKTDRPLDKPENFKIEQSTDDLTNFSIAIGRYYVNGICCENERAVKFTDQPNYPFTDQEKKNFFGESVLPTNYLVYLDVWERHLTYVEDDYMREKALGGTDTATRVKVVWQVKVISNNELKERGVSLELTQITRDETKLTYSSFTSALTTAQKTRPGTGRLKARAKKPSGEGNKPCLTAPEASYRGVENQLYRVEIHNSGEAGKSATFKWSRENGSVIFPIINISDDKITLEHLGRDDRFGLQPGDWVEVLDDDVVLRNEANPLLKVTAVDWENLQVTLTKNNVMATLLGRIATDIMANEVDKHPYLRRWDQRNNLNGDGVIPTAVDREKNWIAIEDGVEIQFDHQLGRNLIRENLSALTLEAREALLGADSPQTPTVYQTGDYWLIPARTATDDVEWPGPVGNPDAVLPHGVQHHYAPLAIITVEANGQIKNEPTDLRRQLRQGWNPAA